MFPDPQQRQMRNPRDPDRPGLFTRFWDLVNRPIPAMMSPEAQAQAQQGLLGYTGRGAPAVQAGGGLTPLAQGGADIARGMGQYAVEHPVQFGMDIAPVIGDVKAAAYDIPRDLGDQNLLGAGLGGLSLVFGPNWGKYLKYGRMARMGFKVDGLAEDMITRATRDGGFTLRLGKEGSTDLGGTQGIAVAKFPGDDLVIRMDENGAINEDRLFEFIEENSDLLETDNHALGGWIRKNDDGTQDLVIDISQIYPRNAQGYENAIRRGTRNDQDAAWDLAEYREYPIFEGARGTEGRVARPQLNPFRSARENAERRATVQGFKANQPQRLQEIREGLTDQERAYFDSKRLKKDGELSDLGKDVEEFYSMAPEPRTFASAILAGSSQLDWYRNSGQAIAETFGDDAPRFTYLLAATSPSKSVQENLNIATNVWANWVEAGRPANVTREQLAEWWPTRLDGDQMKTLDADMGNAMRALNEAEATFAPGNLQNLIDPENPFTQRFLSGGKVDPFGANLLGEVERITNDTHMARGYGTSPANVTSNARVLAQNAMVRNAAREVERLSGGTITGRGAQETSWAFIRALTMMGDAAGKNMDRALADYLSDLQSPTGPYRRLMYEINDSVPFSDLLARPEYADRLRRAGLEPPQHRPLEGMGLTPPEMLRNIRPGDLEDIMQRIEAAKQNKPFYELALPWAVGGGGILGATRAQGNAEGG